MVWCAEGEGSGWGSEMGGGSGVGGAVGGGGSCGNLVLGLVKELLQVGSDQKAAGRQEGGRSLVLVVVLLVDMFVDGLEEQFSGHYKGG